MSEGAKPDITGIDLARCIAKEFPGGEVRPEAGELRVSIGRRVYDEIRKHAAEDSEHEICGVLLGDLGKDALGAFLHVTELIRGEHTASQGAQVTITHETWNHFHKIKDSKFADKQYLGWYHSHPDFGIFLSAMDLFIHENFFNAPHQVALVVDPIRREEGLFCWRKGTPERAGRFWVGRDAHTYEPEPEPSREQLALREVEKKLDRLDLRTRELAEAAARGPEGNWAQTALLMGILLLMFFQFFSGCRQEQERRMNEAEDLFDISRRSLVTLYGKAGGRSVVMRLRLPPDAALSESPTVASDGTVTRVYELPAYLFEECYLNTVKRIKIEEMEERLRKQAEEDKRRREEEEKQRQKEQGSAAQPGPPETSPVGPAPGAGSEPKPGAEGQGRP